MLASSLLRVVLLIGSRLLAIFIVPLWATVSGIKRGEGGTEVGYAGLMLIVGFMHFGLTETKQHRGCCD
jgi:hypothetical protein